MKRRYALTAGLMACLAGAAIAQTQTDGVEVVDIPKTTVSIELVPVQLPDGREIHVVRREIEWPLYDTYVHALDQEDPANPDDSGVVTRPTKPYISMDRGWGHTNYPAMGMSHLSAIEFCTWLSNKTGMTFRLPTEAEWEAIAAQSGTDESNLDRRAWHAENTDDVTEPRAQLDPDDLGLFDLLGNVGEWCLTEDGKPIVRGGSYMDDRYLVTVEAREKPHRSWNATDPQIPKSKWWLADCTWVGIRPIRVPDEEGEETPAKDAKTE